MEFNFNINKYFKNEITTVGPRLIPDGFIGDRREIQECISSVSYVMTVLGENSAKAQGLQKVITSGEKLRNSDHVVYILIDPHEGRGTGLVLGMLKMGVKHLYVFDSNGQNHEVSPKCVLDFYVHESKQRMGLGKKLFEYMLKVEKTEPQYLAIDKPSPKFLSFLRKHYGLEDIIPQTNNFVVFKGFFKNKETELRSEQNEKDHASAGVSPSSSTYDSRGLPGYARSIPPSKRQQRNSTVNLNQTTHFGRPALHRPVSTMGLILQHTSQANSPPSFQPGSANEEENQKNISNLDQVEGVNGETNLEKEGDEIVDPEAVDRNNAAKSLRDKIVDAEILQLPTKPESSPSPTEANENGPPLNCNVQAAKPQHLDLKFYHSSLW